ncbi:hypothetical protein C8J57DRAFT_1460137 [Mycena rebaudengoi]|nr:hypothetical protein C8J57DRAFT_1460137 [Mycena rebaudengoi]
MSAILRTLPSTPGPELPGAFPPTAPIQRAEVFQKNEDDSCRAQHRAVPLASGTNGAAAALPAEPKNTVNEPVTTPKAVPRERKVDANGRRIRSSYFPYIQYGPPPPQTEAHVGPSGPAARALKGLRPKDVADVYRKPSLLQRIWTKLCGGRPGGT